MYAYCFKTIYCYLFKLSKKVTGKLGISTKGVCRICEKWLNLFYFHFVRKK